MDSAGFQVGHDTTGGLRVHGNHVQTLASEFLGMLVGPYNPRYHGV